MNLLSRNDYIITKNGEVINKRNNHKLIPQKNGKGYLRVSISGKLQFVHRLVAETYIPNPNNLPQVNHKDGNKLNNTVENLEWVSNFENRKHAMRNGLHKCGEYCSSSKLCENDIFYILDNRNLGATKLSKELNVSRTTVSDVLHGRTWKKQLKRYAELHQNQDVDVEDKKPLR